MKKFGVLIVLDFYLLNIFTVFWEVEEIMQNLPVFFSLKKKKKSIIILWSLGHYCTILEYFVYLMKSVTSFKNLEASGGHRPRPK